MNKYVELAKSGTSYARKMNLLRKRIFNEVPREVNSKSLKVSEKFSQLPLHKDPDVVDYYHRLPEAHYLMVHLRNYGLFRDEHEDFKDEMERLRKLRGKGRRERPPPKIPEGANPNLFPHLRIK